MSHRQLNLADQTYVKDQYSTSNNLEARMALHERFSTAPRKWFDWYFDQLNLPDDARVLEIGCGTGLLWRENRARIHKSWRLTLSDFSLGMLQTTRATNVSADFLQSDAQSIPFRDSYFDAVIANHMLYHVPDVSSAIVEIRRVLKSTGKFYAATNGDTHLRELKVIVSEFLGGDVSPMLDTNVMKEFSLENGAEQIGKAFAHVERFNFEDALFVTKVEPLVAYIMSGFTAKLLVQKEREGPLRQFVTERFARDGSFRITKSTGLFIASG